MKLQDALDRHVRHTKSGTHVPKYTMNVIVEAARLVANGKEVWLCGSGHGTPMRPGKPLDLSCIFTKGHFEACGRYVQIALGVTEDK